MQSDNRQGAAQRSGEPQSPFAAPAISLPKGGGAIRGIGEKFGANPVTGTASITVPIPVSPGRSGFGPQLALSYDSGAGNGPFGFGWSLSLPSISRKTDKGLPRYLDGPEADVFLLSGAEDLVRVLTHENGAWIEKEVPARSRNGHSYDISLYRPRIEGLFARIERWASRSDATDVFWRSITKDNVATFYGTTSDSRIADPRDPTRIFSWLICESFDDKGNAVFYEYARENSAGVLTDWTHERNRTVESRSANRYVKRILYGNRTPMDRATAPPDDPQWMFEALFDYGEGLTAPVPTAPEEHERVTLTDPEPPVDAWPVRQDAFSTFRAGFDVRTYRLCRRVLMLHRFEAELGVDRYLVRSTHFVHDETPIASFITSVVQSGFRLDGASYITRSMPPLDFEYSQATVDDVVHEVPFESLEQLPAGLDAPSFEVVDLDGRGSPGVLRRFAGGWLHKNNLSPLTFATLPDGQVIAEARFAPARIVTAQPNVAGGRAGGQFLDLAGDGQVDLVNFSGTVPGFYERTSTESWEPFAAFPSLPHVDWSDPNLKFVDLTGDGHADILMSEDDAFAWYPSLGEAGFGASQRVQKVLDEEEGPRLVFADGTQSIYLADMSGDGLADLVRVRNGEVCYWPSLGYARFGAKVTMDASPWLDRIDGFDQRRVRLADIDGSGVTDIIYLGADGVRVYFNHSGNAWGEATRLETFPGTDDLATVQVLDLLGNGTACLVWSSPLPGNSARPMRYIDLMKSQKPHVVVRMTNNIGATTFASYAPSTKFAMLDDRAGTPWISHLPFPVHVVERVETVDHVSRNRFVTRYRYRHGYFDGVEREFRGFGLVEQTDTEALGALGALPAANIDSASHVPPVLTRTWFHTGVYLGRDRVSRLYAGLLDGGDAGEYYREPGLTDEQAEALLLEDTILPAGLTVEEEREACRALKGVMLRQEVYALDAPDEPKHPYTVTEHNYTVAPIQGKGTNRHAVFAVHPREGINYQYERQPQDPRVSHALTLEVDSYGNVRRSLAVAYGRRQADPALTPADRQAQLAPLLTYVENDVTTPIDDPASAPDSYRAPLPSASRTYELTGFNLPSGSSRFGFSSLTEPGFARFEAAIAIPYEASPDLSKEQKRLVEHVRTRYRRDDLTSLLPEGTMHSLALPGAVYTLAFSPGLLSQVYQRTVADQPPEPLLPSPAEVLAGTGADRGGYVDLDADGHWWSPSGRVFYLAGANVADPASTAPQELAQARAHFFLPCKSADAFDQPSTLEYDGHDLFVVHSVDAIGNSMAARYDYRVLQPSQVVDANANRSEAAYDLLGLVAGTAVVGKDTQPVGDTLAEFAADLTESQLDGFYDGDPRVTAASMLAGATTRLVYDLDRFRRTQQAHPTDPSQWLPVYAATLARETHVGNLEDGEQSRIRISFGYSDGLGREIQRKVQAEPGPAVDRGPDVTSRWVCSGWVVFNNKGKPVRQYEPFFSQLAQNRHQFEFGIEVGVSPILFYDALGRVVATLYPDHTWEKVVFDAWRQENWDPNDMIGTDAAADTHLKSFLFDAHGDPRLAPDTYLPTWHALRTDPAHAAEAIQRWPDPKIRDAETAAAHKAAEHAQTPLVTHFDPLGRAFLSVSHNRFRPGGPSSGTPPVEEFYRTRLTFDIESNERVVTDALDRVVRRCDTDMGGNRIHEEGMDAGHRWFLHDAGGKLLRKWDSRGTVVRLAYDELRRLERTFVQHANAAQPTEVLHERVIYGDDPATGLTPTARVQANLRGRTYQQFDRAGIVTNAAYDVDGNLLRGLQQLLQDYAGVNDWSSEPALQGDTFSSQSAYDALNRPVQTIAPRRDNAPYTVLQIAYNEAGLLEAIDVWPQESSGPDGLLDPGTAAFRTVGGVDYDAKGQRRRITYGNGASTGYEYDPRSHRLIRVTTLRGTSRLQDLFYTYDALGNVDAKRDEAQQTIFFDNALVAPVVRYAYDAVYRLIQAEGREHIGQAANNLPEHRPDLKPHYDFNDSTRRFLPHPNDAHAMRPYREEYEYDATGNILRLIHTAHEGSWNRRFTYDPMGNGVRSTTLPGDPDTGSLPQRYHYDVHGNMTKMPHLSLMQWDSSDRLQATSRQVVSAGASPETTYYIHDAAGQRVRQVTDQHGGTRRKERIYLRGLDIYREYDGTGANVTLERQTLHVMDDMRRVAAIETRTEGNDGAPSQAIRYQFSDHVSSACLELDETGAIISYEEFFPYGSSSFQAGRSVAETSLKRYRYLGKERDEETGLYYFGARYYASWLCRWISCDPAGLVDGTNLYRYAACNPATFSDPGGHQTPPQPGSTDAPANEPYTVRGNPDKMFAENPNALKNWNKARSIIMENVYKKGSDAANFAAHEKHLATLDPDGPQSINKRRNMKSRLGYDRYVSMRIQQQFYAEEAKSPTWHYTRGQKVQMARGTAPDPKQQFEHIDGLGKARGEPHNANSVYLTEGGRKGGVPNDSPHGQKTRGEVGRRLERFRGRHEFRFGPGPSPLAFLSLLEPAINEYFGAMTGSDLEARKKVADEGLVVMTPEQREKLRIQRAERSRDQDFRDEVADTAAGQGLNAGEAEAKVRETREATKRDVKATQEQFPGMSVISAPAYVPPERGAFGKFIDWLW